MTTKAVRYTQPLLGVAPGSDALVVVDNPAEVVIRQDGVACTVYGSNDKDALANPVPLGVDSGDAGVSTLGELLVYLEAGRGYEASVTVGTGDDAVTTIVPLPDISPDVDDAGGAAGAAVEDEEAARIAADVALDVRLDVIEALGPLATDAEVAAAVAVEAAARAAAISGLSGTYAPIAEVADRTAADLLKAPIANPTFTGVATAPSLTASGKTGATATPVTLAGGTASGAPSTGAHLKGEVVLDDTGREYYCTVAGTPGTWVQVGGGGTATSITNTPAGNIAAVNVQAALNELDDEKAPLASIAPVRSAAGLIFNDVLTPVTADGMGLGVGQSQHTGTPTPRYFILTGEPSGIVGQLGSDSLATYSPGAHFKAGSLVMYMPSLGTWSQGNVDPNTLATNEVISGAPGVAARSFRIGFNFGTDFRRVTQRWYKVPGLADVLMCQIEISLDETSPSGLVASTGGNPPRISLMFESKGTSAGGNVVAYDSTLDGVSLLTSNASAASGASPGWLFVRSLSDPSSGHYYDDLTTPNVWQFFSTGILPAVLSPPAGLAVTPVASGGSFVAGTYYWRATFLNAIGETVASADASATIVTSGSATITWTGPLPTGATHTRLYRAPTAGAAAGSTTVVSSVAAPTLTFTDTMAVTSVGVGPPATNTTGADSYTTVANRVYRAHLSVTPLGQRPVYVIRFAVGMGMTLADAKRATTNVPNVGPESTITHYQSRVASLPRPATLTPTEATAWDKFLSTVVINERTERDWHPQRTAYDGRPRRFVFNALGRWNALWTMDTPMGLLGYSQVDPQLVRDTLDLMFNHRMDQTTGFLSYDGSVTKVQHGAFLFARLALRYLIATGDTVFAAALYPKLKLMHTWWTTNAPSGNRHPNWPTVKLFTGTLDVEIQEVSPVTTGGNFPSGDDWTTAMAYDFALQMSALATATGNTADVAGWNTAASDYRAAIQTYCWDAGQGWFQPTMTAASPNGGVAGNLGKFNQVITYRAFFHLWAGVATPAQAAIMQAKIMDPLIFKGTYGIRTVDKRWAGYLPDNWVNGASRPYFDAAVSLGLRRYGFTADADTVLAAWVARQNAVGTTPEATNPETGTGGYARYLLTGVMLLEAMLAKSAPTWLGGVGTSLVTS